MNFSKEEKHHYLSLANHAIYAQLTNTSINQEIITQAESMPSANKKNGVFVTLKKNHNLRGCIGCITSTTPLVETIPYYSIQAAINDHRFPPVSTTELSDILITLSVLSPPSPTENYSQIKIGTHGIIFEYQNYRSVFLPEVPIEQQWDLITTLKHLEKKSGAPSNAWKSATYQVFESIKW